MDVLTENPTKVSVHAYLDSRLLELINELADKGNLPVSECVARLLAKAVDRPDLAAVPRKKLGRPRKAKGPKKGKSHVK